MPELPEVEHARSLSQRECQGKTIVEVLCVEDLKVFDNNSPSAMAAALEGCCVSAVRRKGKYFWFELRRGDATTTCLFHFGMAGALHVKGKGGAKYVRAKATAEPVWPPRFTKLELVFGDGTRMAFADSRRFARVKLQAQAEAEPPISLLGPDCLLELPSLEAFRALMAKHKRAVKAVLLDQAVLSGIGNWVGDEVLYQAGLYPEQPSCCLADDEVEALHSSIRDVLAVAVTADSDHTLFPKHWLFHFRWTGKTATTDYHGNKVDFIVVGGRTTAYVPALQKLPAGRVKAVSVVKVKKAAKTPTRGKKAAKPLDIAEAGSSAADADDAVIAVEAEVAAHSAPRRRRNAANGRKRVEVSVKAEHASTSSGATGHASATTAELPKQGGQKQTASLAAEVAAPAEDAGAQAARGKRKRAAAGNSGVAVGDADAPVKEHGIPRPGPDRRSLRAGGSAAAPPPPAPVPLQTRRLSRASAGELASGPMRKKR